MDCSLPVVGTVPVPLACPLLLGRSAAPPARGPCLLHVVQVAISPIVRRCGGCVESCRLGRTIRSAPCRGTRAAATPPESRPRLFQAGRSWLLIRRRLVPRQHGCSIHNYTNVSRAKLGQSQQIRRARVERQRRRVDLLRLAVAGWRDGRGAAQSGYMIRRDSPAPAHSRARAAGSTSAARECRRRSRF